jgi:hypothetical protein
VARLVGGQAGGFWLSLLATALVAVAFQPLRRRVVGLANRLAYGARAQPYEALSSFSGRLARTPSASTLLSAVAAAAGEAVSARAARAILVVPDGGTQSGSWGLERHEGVNTHAVPVRHAGEVLGRIEVDVPRGLGLRVSDERLLQALAEQAAVAFRNAATEQQLAAHVAELDRTTRELGRSRARIIHAEDAARRSLEAAVSLQVMPHLLGLPGDIRAAREGLVSRSHPVGLDSLVDRVNQALDELREISRGVFPAQLERAGLEPALRSYLARAGLAAGLHVDPSVAERRFSGRVEAAVYFVCAQAAAAMSAMSSMTLGPADGALLLQLTGLDGARLDEQSVLDRIEAVEGALRRQGDGLVVTLPLEDALAAGAVPSGSVPRR